MPQVFLLLESAAYHARSASEAESQGENKGKVVKPKDEAEQLRQELNQWAGFTGHTPQQIDDLVEEFKRKKASERNGS